MSNSGKVDVGESVIAVLLSQGDELTSGQTLDTNSHTLAGRLWSMGIVVRRIIVAPDQVSDLTAIIDEAARLADVVIGTGGLGPTRDDLTAEATAAAAGLSLEEQPEALAQIEERFAAMGREMKATNRKPAMLPVGCRVLENRRGTAPGFSIDHRGARLYFLPGPPHEMSPMFDALIAPDILARHYLAKPILHRIGVVMAESVLEHRLRGLDAGGLDTTGLDIGFRASLQGNEVKLRFESDVPAPSQQAIITEILRRLGDAVVGVGVFDPAAALGDLLWERRETLAVAESCTGGALSARLVEISGAGRYFMEGAILYDNAAKVRVCGVSEADLATHGAVSETVACAMAEGMRQAAGTTWGLSLTGITSGGNPKKPAGTLHVALAGPGGVVHWHMQHRGDRARIIQRSVTMALIRTLQRVRSMP